MKADNLKADHATPSAAAALTGAAGRRNLSRRERNKRANEERTSVPIFTRTTATWRQEAALRPVSEEPFCHGKSAPLIRPPPAYTNPVNVRLTCPRPLYREPSRAAPGPSR
ncbi:hypothetical protein GN958_ATG08191 [Phytophthora infestans]|uniref:Uncharacterized protein n=1 Tax=Phytophthora infestans TaxID=4787 RepID=A0A8S9UUB1_PHYIN|nr:hypothetical protein GN958_ATG08191 [Phytophthora infestans]